MKERLTDVSKLRFLKFKMILYIVQMHKFYLLISIHVIAYKRGEFDDEY